jgi:hypothetical protein
LDGRLVNANTKHGSDAQVGAQMRHGLIARKTARPLSIHAMRPRAVELRNVGRSLGSQPNDPPRFASNATPERIVVKRTARRPRA